MPLPPLLPPLLLGGPASSRLLFAASRATASGLLATCLVRALYRSTPEWLREDESWRALIASSDADDDDGCGGGSPEEMATLSAVLGKLQGLVATGHAVLRGGRRAGRRRRVLRHVLGGSSARRLDDGRSRPLTALEWNVALLAYVQLCGQMRDRHPELRDKLYSSIGADESIQEGDGSEVADGKCANDQAVTAADIEELRVYLEFAVWSYEPDEETLRTFLMHGPEGREDCDATDVDRGKFGFRLILHRTTAYIDPPEDSDNRNADTIKSRSSKRKVKKPPGRVGYFVAACDARKELLIGIKGTSSLEDLLTDCCGRAVRVDLEGDPHGLNSEDYDGDERVEESCDEDVIETNLNDETSDNDEDSADESDLGGFYLQLSNNIPSTEDGVEIELLEGMVKEDNSEACEKYHERNRLAGPTRGMPRRSDSALLFPTSPCQPHVTAMPSGGAPAGLPLTHECTGIEAEENLSSGKLRGAHEGILHGARQLLTEIDFLIQEYAVDRGYDVVCTGHSLGAGAAALLAVLIRGRYECLTHPQAVESNEDVGTVPVERIRAVTFASPPVLDGTSALNCRKYVPSVVNNSDIVTRSSLSNLDAFLTVLEAVGGRLAEVEMASPDGDNPNDLASRQPGVIASLISLLKKLSEGVDGDLLLSADQMEQILDESASDIAVDQSGVGGNYWGDELGHLLFVPGRVLLLHEPWDPRQRICERSTGEDAADVRARWTDGTADALKFFDLGARGGLVADHLTSSYQRSLSRYAEQVVTPPDIIC